MGCFGNNENKIDSMKNNCNLDLSFSHTQPVDGGEFDDDDNNELHYIQNTMPVDDVIPFEDAFETQMVDLSVETQLLDLCIDTQVVDLCGETQEVNPDIETQLLDECDTEVRADRDGEESGETEVLCDTQVMSDDDSSRRVHSWIFDREETAKAGLNKEWGGRSEEQSDTFSNGEHCSGSILRGFTSIRAASLRASGLAARKMAIKRAIDRSCSIKGGNSLEQQNGEKDKKFVSSDSLKLGNECNQKNGPAQHDERMNESRRGNTRKAGSATARKLFMDDLVADIRQLDEEMKNDDPGRNLPQTASGNELVGLSYVDSQEPGELSQANALNIVEDFLKNNFVEYDQDVVFNDYSLGKSKPISSAKGARSLAKKASSKLVDGGPETFNWDDNLEDEGGGEFFQKKKELFFDNVCQGQQPGKCSKKPQCLHFKTSMAIEDNRNEVGEPDSGAKSKGALFSGSRLLSTNLRLTGQQLEQTEATCIKNLINDLDDDINSGERNKRADDGTNKDVPEMLDVAFDTQMAADAIEILRFAVGRSDNDCGEGNESAKRARKSSRIDDAEKRSNSKQSFSRKRRICSDAAVVTRQFKASRTGDILHKKSSRSANKESKNAVKQFNPEPVKRGPNKAKSQHSLKVHGIKNFGNILKVDGERKEDTVQVASGDEVDMAHVTQSTCQKTSRKRQMREQHDYDSLKPIGPRTRGQTSHPKGGKTLDSPGKGIDIKRHVTHTKQQAKVGTLKTSSYQGECSKVEAEDHLNKTFADFPKGRRTRSKLPMAGEGAGNEHTTMNLNRLKPDSTTTSLVKEKDVRPNKSKHFNVMSDAKDTSPVEGKKVIGGLEGLPNDRCQPSASASTTPTSCAASANAVSPICMGDEYHKQSCRKNLARSSLMKELSSLITSSPIRTCVVKDSRKRREMTNVRVVFSHHLDSDITKQQKKILSRLGASIASSVSDASHFVADEFIRTRNMLEAIAFGKPVVTHLWLESCGQASCLIDEKNYILRDARKEKEFGFSMPVSLGRASQHALLQGQRVLITPNTKPGKEILVSLVKAVQGLAVEKLGRSTMKDESFSGGLLILSCEEDYEVCVPFLEKGAAVYSSELLLNGIVTQRLEYERHRLFTDNVRRTRSTIWLKRNNKFLPVTKRK